MTSEIELEKLKFTDDETKRILELTSEVEKRRSFEGSYEGKNSYKTLMEIVNGAGLNQETVEEVVKSGKYKDGCEIIENRSHEKNKVTKTQKDKQAENTHVSIRMGSLEENVRSFAGGFVGGIGAGLVIKYFNPESYDPSLYATVATTLKIPFDSTFNQKTTGLCGTFIGNLIGYGLASLCNLS